MNLLKICPVCGYSKLSDTPYDECGFPTYIICPCCGFEFGFDDESNGFSFEEYRNKWIANGFVFFNKKKKPHLWNINMLKKQLENIEKVKYKSRFT